MQSNSYKILFSGQILDNFTPETARSNVRNLLKADDKTLEHLFSGKSIVIKKDLDRKQVDKYVSALNKAGLDVITKPPIVEEFSLEFDESRPQSNKPVASNPYASPAAQDLLPAVHCRQCGTKISASDAVCSNCGAQQLIGKPRSKVTAGLLAIFLGWLGAHRLYLGQWWGILYFLLGILIWPIAIIEGIVFLVTPKDKWDSKYGQVKSLGGVLVFVVCLLIFIAVVGILAAIAIPAYQDYSLRARVHEAIPTIEKTKGHLEQYILKENTVPNSNLEAGLSNDIKGKNLLSIKIQKGGIMQVIFASENSILNEKSILWVPEVRNGRVAWDCSGGSLSRQLRPSQCRVGKYQAEQAKKNTQRFVSENGLLELTVPKSWKQLELAEDAVIELGNIYSEAYLIVYAESKLDLTGYNLKNYADAILEIISTNLNHSKIQYIGDSTVNGLSAIHYRIDGNSDDVDLVYLVTVVGGNQHFYQVVTWSLDSRFSGNQDDLNLAINSFRERQAQAGE